MEISNIANSLGNITQQATKEIDIPRKIEKLETSPKTNQELNAQNKQEIKEKLTETVKELNSQMDMLNTNITFAFNDKIEMLYVNVKERSTGKLIRKFPTEEAMKLAEHMKEFVGIIFDKKG